jgi:hypothetical protein
MLAAGAGAVAADTEWSFEQVTLANGAVLRGLILDESPARVRFQNVRRAPGRPTVVFTTTLARAEIAAVERLPDAERKKLKAWILELEESGPAEKQREESLELETIPWGGNKTGGRRYRSEYFTLESDAPKAMVRRAAVRLEQVYAAYSRYLPPRAAEGPSSKGKEEKASSPTVIQLFQSRDAYRKRLEAERRTFVNIACYDPAANRILCYSDLERLGAELDQRRREHQQLRADLDRQEKDVTRLYRGAELGKLRGTIHDTRKQLDTADRQNDGQFDRATRRLFAVLGHEAFHAYLATAVFPKPQPEPPRWLNEGLAQIFETAVVEAGELRVGHADRDRLARVKDAVRKGQLVPLSKLLRSGSADYLAAHAADREASGMTYLTAWALAFHLTFERNLLGTEFLDRYFAALAHGADPDSAFADLIGQTVPAYEAAFHQYLLQLQSDGTVAAGPKPEK